jgi:hypothetical protein
VIRTFSFRNHKHFPFLAIISSIGKFNKIPVFAITIRRRKNLKRKENKMSFAADILAVNSMSNQISLIRNLQINVSGSANVLSEEIALDAARGGDVSKKEKQLADTKAHLVDLSKSLGSVIKSTQKGIDKVSKEKDTSMGLGNTATSSKDPNVLRKISQKLSAEIAELQNDGATENGQVLQKLQQQLQTVQTQLQQIEAGGDTLSISINAKSANSGDAGQNNGGSTAVTVDITV